MTPAEHWRAELAAWAIPDHIRRQAPAFPYTMDPELFRPRLAPDGESLATERAREGLVDCDTATGAAIDVGCGGGAASMAIADRLHRVVGVDQSESMLAVFADEARQRDLEVATVCGAWPDVAAAAGRADLVLCHHVAYNVADLGPFVAGLDAAAEQRVVMELTLTHPQTANAPLWRHFWDLDRPDGPTARDAFDVITAAGIDARLEFGSAGSLRRETSVQARAVTAARMLCLGPERLPEVERQIVALPDRPTQRAVIWWNT